MIRLIKSLSSGAVETYRTQRSVWALGKYVALHVSRKGPAAIRRRIEKRRSIAHLRQLEGETRPGSILVAFAIGGVIGDNLMAARFLRDFARACPEARFDVYTSNVALGRWIYAGVGSALRNCFQDTAFGEMSDQYDAVFTFGDTIRFHRCKRDPNRHFPEDFSKILAAVRAYSQKQDVLQNKDYNDEAIAAQELLYRHGLNRAAANHFIAGIAYGGDRYELAADEGAPEKYGLAGKRYVTVHNGFDMSQITHNGTSSKVYPFFGEAIKEIGKADPELVFVQLGASTSVRIGNAALNLIGATSLQEAAALIRGAACHLDNESGLVTVASCYGTPACVVFGPTSPDYFAYPGNAVVRPVECGGCWWITRDWARCPRGMERPACMYAQPPGRVSAAALALLNRAGG